MVRHLCNLRLAHEQRQLHTSEGLVTHGGLLLRSVFKMMGTRVISVTS